MSILLFRNLLCVIETTICKECMNNLCAMIMVTRHLIVIKQLSHFSSAEITTLTWMTALFAFSEQTFNRRKLDKW